ncbi:MAG: hypothetical protein JWP87_5603 [Labilithrix sp.]|nr:hypothetical protein [Labilithrix sp.]
MSGPYRTPGEPARDAIAAAEPVDLGGLRSSHPRAATRSVVATAVGGLTEIDLHDSGLALRDATAGRVELPFEEIDAVYFAFDGLLPRPPNVVLRTFEGTSYEIPSDVRGLDRIVEAIDRTVTWPITVRAKEALSRGEPLVFGPLVLELDGIVLHGQSLGWKHLSRVDAERDSVIFYAREPLGRFGWARLADLPHPRALLDVLRMRTRVVLRGLELPGSR